MYLQEIDPWLGFKWGKDLTQRNFRERDGVYGDNGKIDGIMLADGNTKMMDRSHSNSCGSCHNVPYRDGGAGMTIAKNGATGRNTPHMFGTGIMEMIGQQIRLGQRQQIPLQPLLSREEIAFARRHVGLVLRFDRRDEVVCQRPQRA